MPSHGHNEDKYNLFFIIFYSIYKNNAAQHKEHEQQALKSCHSKKNTVKYHLLTTFKGGNSFNNLLQTFVLHTF